MMPSPAAGPRAPGRAEQFSTRAAFFIAGFVMAGWAPLVPFAKQRAGLDEGRLGLLLLCLGVGSLLAMPTAAALASRHGCRRILVPAVVVLAASFPLLALLSDGPALGAALFVFGAALGALDCTANLQAVIVERAAAHPMMSGFHGMFSLGGIAGSAGVAALLGAGVSPLTATLCVLAIVALVAVPAAPHFLAGGTDRAGPPFAVPHGIVLVIGAGCFILFLVEGAVLDWSAVFLTGARRMDPGLAGFGYAAFAATMTVGRLTGDRLVRRWGPVATVAAGGLGAALGLAMVVGLPSPPMALAGFALVGAGCSNIVPVLYSAAGRQRTMPQRLAVPAITTLGYAGILLGPAGIGFVAQAWSLQAALLMLAGAMLVVAACAPMLRPDRMR